MKYLCLFSILIISCATKQRAIITDEVNTKLLICPDDGICTIEVMVNQSLSFEKDGIGSLYPKISDGNKTIIKFEYKRNEIPNTVDGQYSELIYLELDPENLELDLEDGELKNVKALFARLCFCRGQTGYYPINQGHLSIQKHEANQYHLSMRFKVNEVPQIISTFNEVLTIK